MPSSRRGRHQERAERRQGKIIRYVIVAVVAAVGFVSFAILKRILDMPAP